MEFFFDRISPIYNDLLSRYSQGISLKQALVRMIDDQNGIPFFYSPNMIADDVCAFETSGDNSETVNPCSAKTTAAIYISPHMNTPDVISAILRQIIELSRSDPAAAIDFGISYIAPHNNPGNFAINHISALQSLSGISY